MTTEEPLPTVYALRIMPCAEQDILTAVRYMADAAGEAVAQEWQEELFAAISSLGTLPRRCALAREERFFSREVRQIVFRRGANRAAYRVLFRVVDGGRRRLLFSFFM
jgi:plasmid stabilization system protein ParE